MPFLPRIFTHRDCLLHDNFDLDANSPESPQRLKAILNACQEQLGQRIVMTGADSISNKALNKVHPPSYIERFEAACFTGKSHFMSTDNGICYESLEAAQSAAGQAYALGQHMTSGGHGFAAVRPPGHHASAEKAEGFCFFNNAAICVEAILEKDPGKKILIVDIDVHHGNGTQNIFCRRSDVYTLSLHAPASIYPYSGLEENIGIEEGEGFNLNKVLPLACSGAEWLATLKQALAQVQENFEADYLILLAGFDAHQNDPMQLMQLTHDDFLQAANIIRNFAIDHCSHSNLGIILEGGYQIDVLRQLVPPFLEEALGIEKS